MSIVDVFLKSVSIVTYLFCVFLLEIDEKNQYFIYEFITLMKKNVFIFLIEHWKWYNGGVHKFATNENVERFEVVIIFVFYLTFVCKIIIEFFLKCGVNFVGNFVCTLFGFCLFVR